VVLDGQRYRGGAVSVAPLDDARPADTLCFVIDGYDPVPRRARRDQPLGARDRGAAPATTICAG